MELEPRVVIGDKRKIAVIGAGMTGLCALRYFSEDPKYSIVAFERSSVVGGIWNYPDQCEEKMDETGLESYYCRIYRGLRLNSPRCLTGYPDYPFPKGTDTYCGREVALGYFQDFARHFNLLELIKFRHEVKKVHPIRGENNEVERWTVEALDHDTGVTTTAEFDNVIVCNGHFHKPYIPEMEGLDKFRGTIIHSGQYRFPEAYTNKNVLIVGGRASANDLACELIPHAKQIFICRRIKSAVFKAFPNIVEVTDISSFGANYVTFKEGYTHPINAIIFCTGFLFNFPFLTEDCGVKVTRGRVQPVYRHIMHCHHPSLAFIGLANRNLIGYYKACLDGKVKLPSAADRLAAAEKEHEERLARGIPEHNAHVMTLSQWAYIDQLSAEAGFASYEPIAKVMYELNIQDIRNSPHGFRNYRIEKIDSEHCLHIPINPKNGPNGTPMDTPKIINAATYQHQTFHLPTELRG